METLKRSLIAKYELNFQEIDTGDKISKLVESEDYWQVKEAEKLLEDAEHSYRESKQKRWIVMVIGLIIAGLLGYYITNLAYDITKSSFDRSGIDKLFK